MAPQALVLARKALKKPPRVVIGRAWAEATVRTERYRGPARARRLNEGALLAALGDSSVDACWERLRRRPFLLPQVNAQELDRVAPGERRRVESAAARAAARELDLLGTGAFRLTTPADWHTDVRTGVRWEPAWWRDIDYAQLDQPSDVKVPWEISRLQWLLPCGQAYLIDGDETHARVAREVVDEWLEANPYGESVNWATAMEPALRLLTFTWLFHALADSDAWRDRDFRFRFLRGVYLHGDFVARNLELSDVNGNHLDADAAGLVFAGLFFGSGRRPQRWSRTGWSLLLKELPRQVTPDGVDFEMSTAYHRLVTELFLLPALLRRRQRLPVPPWYMERLEAMAHFAATYTRVDGSSPAWGDADDARALPLGAQPLGDHRYLALLVAAEWGADVPVGGPRVEAAWLLGPAAAATPADTPAPTSTLFASGGAAVLREKEDHVFVDCGPVGLAGRGGHGHNDVTSVDAMLLGQHIVVDPGTYTYTASRRWRNLLRGSESHNALRLDYEELNRFGEADHLWSLRDDARPVDVSLRVSGGLHVLHVGHTGYRRLDPPAGVSRTVVLDARAHRLLVVDTVDCGRARSVSARYTFPAGARVDLVEGGARVGTGSLAFDVRWSGWRADVVAAAVSPSYGVLHDAPALHVSAEVASATLALAIGPAGDAEGLDRWLEQGVS